MLSYQVLNNIEVSLLERRCVEVLNLDYPYTLCHIYAELSGTQQHRGVPYEQRCVEVWNLDYPYTLCHIYAELSGIEQHRGVHYEQALCRGVEPSVSLTHCVTFMLSYQVLNNIEVSISGVV